MVQGHQTLETPQLGEVFLLVGPALRDMKRVTLLETAPIPGNDGELGLYQHGEDFVIKVMGGQDLMSTRTHGFVIKVMGGQA